ncbi:MAG: DHH family phosphoesterase [Clostridia bacterium]|nr:DHH family phosphoesterase [Clostridia bacterium]
MKKMSSGLVFMGGLIFSIIAFLTLGLYDINAGNDLYIATAEILVSVGLFAYMLFVRMSRRKGMEQYISLLTEKEDSFSYNAVSLLPLPMAVLSVDGHIMWYNDLFVGLANEDKLYNIPIFELIPSIKWHDLLKSENIDTECEYEGRILGIIGKIVRKDNDVSVILYFDDRTEERALSKKYEDTRTVVGLVVIDNYDDLFSKLDDVDSQQASTMVNKHIVSWAKGVNGIIKRLQMDRYLVMFENKCLPECIEKKFDVLQNIRAVGDEFKLPISVSIGIGIGERLADSDEYSRAALDMAQARGGDQAVIKDLSQFTFYGGKTKEYEKSTRVKTRSFAKSFKDLIVKSDSVFFMGHSNADYDSFGASVGLSRACRDNGKKVYIVYDNSPAVEPVVMEMRQMPEYEGMLITAEHAAEIMTEDSLLVIVDTHRPSMLPSDKLLKITQNIVLIDHHRRSTEFLPYTSLQYHEPYASSTSEMASEILQYISDKNTISAFEAKALYMGILMDTKNFMIKTGVRTFEAASFLRKCGLDPVEVKRLFSMDKGDYIQKIRIMESLEIYEENIAIAFTEDKHPNIRVISSIACDDMLNIKGVKASFVIYMIEGTAYISGRSFGDVNVQLILEKLGGGGHITVAGAQIKGSDTANVKDELKKAISQYIEESKTEQK